MDHPSTPLNPDPLAIPAARRARGWPLAPRRWLVAAALVCMAVLVCMRWIDRTLALWFDRFSDTPLFAVLLRALDIMNRLALLGGAVLVLTLAARAVGARLPAWLVRVSTALVAAALALAVTLLLKWAAGRSAVHPDFAYFHRYGFRPFHAGSRGSFPSSTLAVWSAFLLALRDRARGWRIAAGGVLALLALAVLLIGGHWLSDLIAGSFLGAACAALVSSRGRPRAAAPAR